MRIIRRGLYAIITLALTALLFWPQPFFKPDWITPLDNAIAAEDCDKINDIMSIALISGLPGANEKLAEIELKNLCDYAFYRGGLYNDRPVTDEHIMRFARSQDDSWRGSFWHRMRDQSLFTRLYWRPAWGRHLEWPSDWRLYDAASDFMPHCIWLMHPKFGGAPSYQYMGRFLDGQEIDASKMEEQIFEDRKLCARQIIALAKRLETDPNVGADSHYVATLWFHIDNLDHRDPELIYAHGLWADKIYNSRKSRGLDWIEAGFTLPTVSAGQADLLCRPDVQLSLEMLVWCAKKKISQGRISTFVGQPAIAYYFSLLAEAHLPDVKEIQEEAKGELAEHCVMTVKTAHAKDGDTPWANESYDFAFWSILGDPACRAGSNEDAANFETQTE